MNPRTKIILIILFIATLIALLFARPKAQALNILPSKTIEVVAQAPATTPPPELKWTFLSKLVEAKIMVASPSMDLKVGKKDIIYYENRIKRSADGEMISISS